MAESIASPGRLGGLHVPRPLSSRRALGALLIVAVALGAGIAASSVLSDSSTRVGGPSNGEPSLTLSREGANTRACFEPARCVTTSSPTDFAVRLDPAADAASSNLLVLSPSGTVVEFGSGAVTKTAGTSVATVFALEGIPRCVDFSLTLPGSKTPSLVSVDMTRVSTGIAETSSDQACRAL